MTEDEILRAYLGEIRRIHATGAGTAETSYYGALQGAVNAVGRELEPAVYCLSQMSGKAIFPDFGLFSDPQFGRGGHPAIWSAGGPVPERGVIEADDVPAPLSVKRSSAQVAKYLAAYGLVLITNFREFELLEAGTAGAAARVVERFSFGMDTAEFFSWASHPRKTHDAALAMSFVEFLRRAMRRQAPLAEPRDVATLMASYARDGLSRLTLNRAMPTLEALRDALGSSLGLNFEPNPRGEHFFCSTLVQTLFYGLFSSWAAHAKTSAGRFDWHTSTWTLHVPAVRALFEQVATPDRLGQLELVELLNWAADALNRVDQPAFFARFKQAEAVQHFYEPFLAAYDPALRKALGVWYTPAEIVRYMVERVDRALRTELRIADGLADPNVWVLDPCTGTGSYLVAVLQRIRQTLEDKGVGATLGAELKAAATRRLVGFEVLPAPFVIAHWQIGNFLAEAGAPLDITTGERASIYLTNALTGWESRAAWPRLPFPELERERDLANGVKQVEPVLVILGNPPYSAFDGTSPDEEGGLVTPYKRGLRERWKVRKFNLDDLYVRFFRIAERRIADVTGRGIVCFITNSSYLSYRSFTVMRERLVKAFDSISIDAMNGDSRQTGKLTPDGRPDPSAFSTALNPAGIRVGTAIALLVRDDNSSPKSATVAHRSFWGASKRMDLEATLDLGQSAFDATFAAAHPSEENRFKLAHDATLAVYRAWPSLAELSISEQWSGVLEKRKGSLMAHDRASLEQRITRYCSPGLALKSLGADCVGLTTDAARFDAKKARAELILGGGIAAGRFVKMMPSPLDQRWCFHTDVSSVWNESRPQLAAQQRQGNTFIVTRTRARQSDEGIPVFATRDLPGDHSLDPNAHPFPVILHRDAIAGGLDLHGDERAPNLSARAVTYLRAIGRADWATANHQNGDALWMSALAIAYAPAWLEEHEDGILEDWPRMPLPNSAEALEASLALGRRVADLLDPNKPVPGVTSGPIQTSLRTIAVPSKVGGGSVTAAEMGMTARWGSRNKTGAVMPGKGLTSARDYAGDESACAEHATELGTRTQDVFLNDNVYWRNIPDEVWDFRIGGFQILKKWLSYRVEPIIERPLTLDEVNYFQGIARRLAALRRLGPELDENYSRCAQDSYAWRTIDLAAT